MLVNLENICFVLTSGALRTEGRRECRGGASKRRNSQESAAPCKKHHSRLKHLSSKHCVKSQTRSPLILTRTETPQCCCATLPLLHHKKTSPLSDFQVQVEFQVFASQKPRKNARSSRFKVPILKSTKMETPPKRTDLLKAAHCLLPGACYRTEQIQCHTMR